MEVDHRDATLILLQLAAGDLVSAMQTASSLVATPPTDRPMSAPPPPAASGLNGSVAPKPPLASPAPSTVSAFAGDAPRPSRAKGLQLGASKQPVSLAAQIAAADEDDDGEIEDAWGGDLMDVTADEGDWSACACAETRPHLTRYAAEFESAPVQADEVDNPWAEAAAAPPSLSLSQPPRPKPRPAPVFASAAAAAPKPTPAPAVVQQPVRASAVARAARPAVASPPAPKASDGWGASWGDEDDDAGSIPPEPAEAEPPVPAALLSKEDKAAEMARRREERKQVRVLAVQARWFLTCAAEDRCREGKGGEGVMLYLCSICGRRFMYAVVLRLHDKPWNRGIIAVRTGEYRPAKRSAYCILGPRMDEALAT